MDCNRILEKWLEELTPVEESPNSACKMLYGKKIILYGAGDGFFTFSAFVLSRFNLEAVAILDKCFIAESIWNNIRAYHPTAYTPSKEDQENAVAVITVGKSEYQQEIVQTLHSMGFRNTIFASEIYEYHIPCSTTGFLTGEQTDCYRHSREQILESLALFNEDESRQVFMRFMETHLRRKATPIPCHPVDEQYFPKDIPMKRPRKKVINCGSYDGDTAIKLCMAGGVEALACFEPDPDNYKLLRRNLGKLELPASISLALFPCAVFSSEKQLRFAAGNRINSMITENGESVIQTVSLDNALPGFMPDFINMDIEGAELEALKGAEALIKESKPDLAVCVYHSPEHLWRIPLFLDSLGLGYRLFFRNYTSYVSETVLYATTGGA